MGLQGYALPSHENIGTAPFTSAPGLTLDGIQSVRDLTDISPVVQSHEDAVMPNALFRTPIRQPLTDYTEARFPTGAFEYHKSQKERIPTHQEDFDLRFQTSSAVDNHLFDLQKMTRDQWSTDIQDSRIVMKHGRPVHVKYDQLSGTDQIVGDVWNPEHYNVGLAPFQNDLQHTLTTPGLGRSDYWGAPTLESWGRAPLKQPPGFELPSYYPYRPHAPNNKEDLVPHPLPLKAQLEQYIKMDPSRRDLSKGFIDKTFRGYPVVRYDDWSHPRA